MTSLTLIRISLVHTFGSYSDSPFKTAFLKLSSITVSAAACSILFGQAVSQIPFTPSYKGWLVWLYLLAASFLCATLSYLASAGLYVHGADTFRRLLQVWPMPNFKQWLLRTLPRLYVGILSVLLIAGVTIAAGTGLGLSLGLILLALSLGYILSTFSLWLLDSLARGRNRNNLLNAAPPLWSVHLPGWLLKSVGRSHSTQLSFMTALALSTTMTSIAAWRHFSDVTALSLLVALLSASFCSDIRSLLRKYKPAEIAAMKGTASFMQHYTTVAIIGTIGISLPMLLPVISSQAQLNIHIVFLTATQLFAGCAAGILGGTMAVPRSRDLSGQFSAVLLCCGILFLPPYVPFVRSLMAEYSVFMNLILALTSLAIAQLIEYKRNPYTWRSHAQIHTQL